MAHPSSTASEQRPVRINCARYTPIVDGCRKTLLLFSAWFKPRDKDILGKPVSVGVWYFWNFWCRLFSFFCPCNLSQNEPFHWCMIAWYPPKWVSCLLIVLIPVWFYSGCHVLIFCNYNNVCIITLLFSILFFLYSCMALLLILDPDPMGWITIVPLSVPDTKMRLGSRTKTARL